MKQTRPYRQTVRAEAAEQTRRRILTACFELQSERLTSEISLEDVATRAEVSVQTILRRFGSRAALIEEAIVFINAEVAEERSTPVGDLDSAVKVIVDHYEKRGEMALLMLAQESTYPHLRQLSEAGKKMHRAWVAEAFAPYLKHRGGGRDEALLDLLVVATDVYTWKLLRRDRGLSRRDTENRIKTLVIALLPEATEEKDEP